MKDILGEGGFGTVVLRNGLAVKMFKNIRHLIHEYTAALYLKKCPYIVQVHGIDFDALEMTMDLYDGSISKWLKDERTEQQKCVVLHEILKALTCLYDLGLVHGDIKPGNTLVKWNSNGDVTRLVLGDVGFLSIQGYSKVFGTTRTYQEYDIESDYRHDMYSLGVFITEMFQDIKFTKKDIYDTKIHHAKKISNQKIRHWTLRMMDLDRSERPSPRRVLYSIFEDRPPVQMRNNPGPVNTNLTQKEVVEIQKIFVKWAQPYMTRKNVYKKINRTKIAYQACIQYISVSNIVESQRRMCAYAILTIFSSIFGDLKLSPEAAANQCGVNKSTMRRCINRLLVHEDLLIRMFYCKDKDMKD